MNPKQLFKSSPTKHAYQRLGCVVSPRTSIAATTIALLSTLAITPPSFAHDYKIGQLTIAHPFSRATPPGAQTAGGYLIITNHGDTADRLLGGSAVFAGVTEVHEMKMEDNLMKMRHLPNGIEIQAGETLELRSGGYHMMFMKINQQLKVGEKHAGTLMFEKAGEVDITYNVEPIQGHQQHGSSHGNGHAKMEMDKKTDDKKHDM